LIEMVKVRNELIKSPKDSTEEGNTNLH
jgi:hypothetical protein